MAAPSGPWEPGVLCVREGAPSPFSAGRIPSSLAWNNFLSVMDLGKKRGLRQRWSFFRPDYPRLLWTDGLASGRGSLRAGFREIKKSMASFGFIYLDLP